MINPADIVRVKPPRGCCNSTLCFQEWQVLSLFNVTVKNRPDIKMAVLESEGHVDIFRVARLEKIPLKVNKKAVEPLEVC